MNNKEKVIIATLILLLAFTSTYFVIDKFFLPYIQNQQELGIQEGVYRIALDQTENSRVFYITQNNTLEVIGVEELCGVEK